MGDEMRLGRYVLDKKLATGGMAEIWLAHQEGPAGFAKEIVIKRILSHLAEDPNFVEMFLDEARLAARLNHPNIVQIFDLGEADGFFFIAMEFIDGRDLQTIIERAIAVENPVRPAIAARVVADACMALDYAHHFKDRDGTHVQLVHRDVSPQNILVSHDGIVKLVDFGVAKAATQTHKTQTGAVKGKLSYMSPEQISGKLVDARSDIFALGIVLYELVTNRRPFGHESDLLAITAILNEQPTMPREVIRQLPPELEAIILKALEKDAAQRFQTASEMQVALEEVLQRMGAILTPREVREYFDDLFSDAPTGAVAALDRLASITGTPIDAAPIPGEHFTHVEHPSRDTRPNHGSADTRETEPIPEEAETRKVKLAGALAAAAHRQTDPDIAIPTPGRRNNVGIVVALLIVFGLVGSGAWVLYGLIFGDPAPTDADAGSVATQIDADEALDAGAADRGQDVAAAADTGQQTAAAGATDGAASPTEADGSGDPTATEADAVAHAADTVTEDAATPPAEGSAALPAADAAPAGDTTASAEAVPDVDEPPEEADATEATDTDSPSAAEPREDRRERPRNGTVRVIVNAAGQHTVYIDGSRVGSHPGNTRFTVSAGSHTVRVESDSGESSSHRVQVDGGETETIRIR